MSVLPPGQNELVDLCPGGFPPLSIAVLAQQLRSRSAAELGERLRTLLADHARSPIALPGTPAGLAASLRLSLDRPGLRNARLCVRWGCLRGAMELDLLAITGLGGEAGATAVLAGATRTTAGRRV